MIAWIIIRTERLIKSENFAEYLTTLCKLFESMHMAMHMTCLFDKFISFIGVLTNLI